MPAREPAACHADSRPRRPAVAERRARRREQYLDAIVDAIRTYGPDLTMDQLAAAAGVSKPLLYTHFGDRVGLATALAERMADTSQAEPRAAQPASPAPAAAMGAPPTPSAAVLSSCEQFVRFADVDPHLFRWLLRVSHDGPAVLDCLLATGTWRDLVADTGLAGHDPHAVDVLTAAITGFLLAATNQWLTRPTMPRDALLHYLSTFINHALHPQA
jgi:AcrR family transcriptional regulator